MSSIILTNLCRMLPLRMLLRMRHQTLVRPMLVHLMLAPQKEVRQKVEPQKAEPQKAEHPVPLPLLMAP
jgi:hypothetical protein